MMRVSNTVLYQCIGVQSQQHTHHEDRRADDRRGLASLAKELYFSRYLVSSATELN